MQCVFCENTTTVNTSMTITLEGGEKATVHVCDDHAEEATAKKVKAAFLARKAQIDDLLAKAKALGINIATSPSGLAVATIDGQAEPVKPKQRQQQINRPPVDEFAADDNSIVVPTSKIDNAAMQSVGGNTPMGNVESHSHIDRSGFNSKLDPTVLEGKVKLVQIEGRAGKPTAIPERRVDGTGTTIVSVSRTDDASLQRRFKDMADRTVHFDEHPFMAQNGYSNTLTNCTMCRGECTIKVRGVQQACPKCKGAGTLSL
jgi:hypothetical protein